MQKILEIKRNTTKTMKIGQVGAPGKVLQNERYLTLEKCFQFIKYQNEVAICNGF